MVGGAQRILEMTLNYVKERSQFGQPIGSFQAIQHHCTNIAVDVETSRLNTYYAAWLLSEGLPSSKHVAVAKAWVSEAYRRITSLSHQTHGAIGFTKELDLELFVRRAKAGEVAFGDTGAAQRVHKKPLLVGIAQTLAHAHDPVRRDFAFLSTARFHSGTAFHHKWSDALITLTSVS